MVLQGLYTKEEAAKAEKAEAAAKARAEEARRVKLENDELDITASGSSPLSLAAARGVEHLEPLLVGIAPIGVVHDLGDVPTECALRR